MKRLAAAALCLGLIAGPQLALADTVASPTAAQVLDSTGADHQVYVAYLGGVYDGLLAGTSFNNVTKQPEIFCMPGDAALSDSDIWKILGDYIQSADAKERNQPVSVEMLFALRQHYPCKS